MKATRNILFVCFILSLGLLCESKIYSKCEFAKALKKQGITNRGQLGTWTCIAHYESRFNSKAVNSKSGDYGILQINHRYWCSDTNTPGKGCNITCKSLLRDDITGSIKCAKKVYAETKRISKDGFTAWVPYKQHCRGDQSKWISGCKL